MKILNKIFTIAIVLICTVALATAQVSPINFEPAGNGATWTWTTFENVTNLPTQIVANPSSVGINTSANVIKMTTLVAGKPWAGFESLHGAGIGTFTLNSTNAVIKLMVYKSVISDVGVKFATAAGASTGEIKVANTKINQWEELTFNFTAQIGNAVNTNIDQIIIFPDFKARTTDNDCYIDNITLGVGTSAQPIQVKFAVQQPDSTPVFVFGNWNNWSNFPGTPLTYNSIKQYYEATLPFNAGSTIEYLFVNGTTKEVLNSNWACTNGNPTYTNRIALLGNADTTLCNVWQSCNNCNPASITAINNDVFTIQFLNNYLQINNNVYKDVDGISIMDMYGKTIFTQTKSVATNQQIELPQLPASIYFVVFKKGANLFTTKIIKQ